MFEADNQRVHHIGNLPALFAVDKISWDSFVVEVINVICCIPGLSGNGIRVIAYYLEAGITGTGFLRVIVIRGIGQRGFGCARGNTTIASAGWHGCWSIKGFRWRTFDLCLRIVFQGVGELDKSGLLRMVCGEENQKLR